MPNISIPSVKLSGLSVVTGPVVRTLEEDAHRLQFDEMLIKRMHNLVGIQSRHIAPHPITTLDLCHAAATDLLESLNLESDSIDAVVFVTQTPDHFQPCNANLLHGLLDLPKSTAAFDVNQGCSGWVYGLYLAALMTASGGCRRVLLLAGDTVTHNIHPQDRSLVLLFGDAGSASLIEATNSTSPWHFSLHSDGKGKEAIIIPAGGYRNPQSEETSQEKPDPDGNIRTPNSLFMNGVEVFNFTLREEPAAVRDMLEFAGMSSDSIDYFVFHQANRYILQNLAHRLKLPLEKVPFGAGQKYGNQSSASIPAAIAESCGGFLRDQSPTLLCSGFGVGLSWASAIFQAKGVHHCQIRQYCPDEK